MAGQPQDGSWARSRQQPQSYEQAESYEQQAPYQHQEQQAPYQHQEQQAYQAPGQQARQATRSKGFVASLFDFSFSSFVTPKLIRALYVLATVWTAVLTIAFCNLCLHFGNGGGMIVFLIIAAPVLFLLGLGCIRVALEVFMVLHRLNENIQAIRDRGDMS